MTIIMMMMMVMLMIIALTQSIFKLGPLDFAWKQIQIYLGYVDNDDDDDDNGDNDYNDDDDVYSCNMVNF